MTREEILDLCGKTAREAQIRDDVCSRSTLLGLKAYFDWIPDEMIRASMNLCGGAGASSGSSGHRVVPITSRYLSRNFMNMPALISCSSGFFSSSSRGTLYFSPTA
ncbi:MAG: hypothetical protein K6C09_05535, partial [Oscillospiraceae bacterium]|nr:hypothetical protein [Oscillospiraceae bacterium]